MLPHLGQQFLPTLEREGTLSSAERTFVLDYTRRESVHATLLSHSKSVLFLRPPSHDGRLNELIQLIDKIHQQKSSIHQEKMALICLHQYILLRSFRFTCETGTLKSQCQQGCPNYTEHLHYYTSLKDQKLETKGIFLTSARGFKYQIKHDALYSLYTVVQQSV